MENGRFKKNNGFTVIYNNAARDMELSESALGLYIRIATFITLPDLEITKNFICSHCASGEKAFNRAWKELKVRGYLLQNFYSMGKSKWQVEYELLNEPSGDGIHTRWFNAKGEEAQNNITFNAKIHERDKKKIEKEECKIENSTDSPKGVPVELENEDSKNQRIPPFGVPVVGVSVKGVSIKNKTTNKTIDNKSISISLSEKENCGNKADCDVDENISVELDELKTQISYDCFDGVEKLLVDDILYAIDQEILNTSNKEINVGSKDKPCLKPVQIVKKVIREKLTYPYMRVYVLNFMNRSRPVTNPVRYHIKSIYNECIGGFSTGYSRYPRDGDASG